MNAKDITDLNGVTAYWAGCLIRLGSEADLKVAYDMTAVVANDRWDEWYAEGEGDPFFVEVFDLVADLETPIERELSREDAWDRVKELVAEMQ